MSGLFSVPKAPKILPPPTDNSKEVQEAAAAEAELQKRRRKRGLTVTGPTGVSGEPTTLKTTLGG